MTKKASTIKDRVIIIAENADVTKESFFKSIGMTSANFRGKAKDTPLNSNAIVNIITLYPEVDLFWLLTGERKIVKYNTESYVEEAPRTYKTCDSCDDKNQLIKALQDQIEELKSDKEDLKKMIAILNK